MPSRDRILVFFPWLLISSLLCFEPRVAIASQCELSVRDRNTMYNYSLLSPSPKFPHGVQSEDGFYKIKVNGTLLWFQLCDLMVFNHDPPNCLDCQGCGGPLRCGMKCSALVANNEGGYRVCNTIGYASNLDISLIDIRNPHTGVVVKMSTIGREDNCSLSVSVFCDSKEAEVPNSFQVLGPCHYATEMRHPSACAKIISANGRGWGWFGTLITTILCLLGGYLLIGTIYRFFFLGIHSVEAIPNLEFWLSLPQRTKIMLGSLVRKLRGRPLDSRGSYAPVNY